MHDVPVIQLLQVLDCARANSILPVLAHSHETEVEVFKLTLFCHLVGVPDHFKIELAAASLDVDALVSLLVELVHEGKVEVDFNATIEA